MTVVRARDERSTEATVAYVKQPFNFSPAGVLKDCANSFTMPSGHTAPFAHGQYGPIDCIVR